MTKKSFGTPVSGSDSNDSGSLVNSPARNTRTQIAARAENDTALDESDSESDDEGDLAPMLNSDLDSSLFLSEEDPDDRAHVFYLDDCAKDALAKFLEETAIAGAIVSHNKDLIESAPNYNDAVGKFLFHHDYRADDDDVANEAREMMILWRVVSVQHINTMLKWHNSVYLIIHLMRRVLILLWLTMDKIWSCQSSIINSLVVHITFPHLVFTTWEWSMKHISILRRS